MSGKLGELYRILHPLTPSFPRKRESIGFGNGKAAIGRGALDSRFRGNDGMGKNDDGEGDV